MAYSRLIIRCFNIGNTHTTIALEPEFWDILEEICIWEGKTPTAMVCEITQLHGRGSRASTIRTFIVRYFRACQETCVMGRFHRNSARNESEPGPCDDPCALRHFPVLTDVPRE
jgi:predicted DNA-binding ribbon-helix-helix protein